MGRARVNAIHILIQIEPDLFNSAEGGIQVRSTSVGDVGNVDGPLTSTLKSILQLYKSIKTAFRIDKTNAQGTSMSMP